MMSSMFTIDDEINLSDDVSNLYIITIQTLLQTEILVIVYVCYIVWSFHLQVVRCQRHVCSASKSFLTQVELVLCYLKLRDTIIGLQKFICPSKHECYNYLGNLQLLLQKAAILISRSDRSKFENSWVHDQEEYNYGNDDF